MKIPRVPALGILEIPALGIRKFNINNLVHGKDEQNKKRGNID